VIDHFRPLCVISLRCPSKSPQRSDSAHFQKHWVRKGLGKEQH